MPVNNYKRPKNIKIKRNAFWACAIFCQTLIFGIIYFKLEPIGFRQYLFKPIRELRLLKTELNFSIGSRNIKKIILTDVEKIFMTSSDGLKITADLYKADNIDPAGAILLLHGSAPWGRKAGLIRLLAVSLKEFRFEVLAPDARGFGN